MNDSFDRNIVVIIFVFVISYLNYLSVKIRSRTGWSNMKCNPISLFSNSIFQTQDEANKDFERCVVGISASTTTEMFKKQRASQEKVLTNLSGIEKKYDTLSSRVDNYTKEVNDVMNDYNNKFKDVKDTQKKANELNTSTTSNIDKYIGSIQDIFKNITSYFKN